jgi:hypothetical protein
MSVVVTNRYNGGTSNEVVPLVKEWKEILEKNGAESVRLSRFFTGPFVGQWLFVVRYSDWAAYARYQDALSALAGDTKFKELQERGQNMQQVMERIITVEIDI